MRKQIIIPILLLFSYTLNGQKPVNFDECLQKAKAHHPLGLNMEQLNFINNYKIKSISTGWLPSVDFSAQATWQSDVMALDINLPPTIPIKFPEPHKDQYKATIDINQVLFDGGAIKKQKEMQLASNNVDRQQLEVDLYPLNESVARVYFTILLLQENETLLRVMEQEIQDKYKAVEAGVRNGVLLHSNQVILQAEKLKLEQQLEEISIARDNALQILSILTGDDYQKDGDFNIPAFVIDSLTDLNRPEFKLFDYQQVKISSAEALVAARRMPRLFAFAQIGYGRPGLNYLNTSFDSFYMLGMGLKWNMWDWGKAKNERQSLKIQASMIDNFKDNLDRNLRIALEKESGEIRKLKSAIERDKEIIALRTEAVNASSSQLEHGVITATNYLTELNAKIQAEINLQTHKILLSQAMVNYLNIRGAWQ